MHDFSTPSSRWQALITRNSAANNKFVYCVRTTRIYCRPICKARLARRANVEFFATPLEAENAGYRACKRCRPELPTHSPENDKIDAVCQKLLSLKPGQPLLKLEDMATLAGLTKFHFHRSFKRVTGLTPKAYLSMITQNDNASMESPSTAMDQSTSDWCEAVTAVRHGVKSTNCITWSRSDNLPNSSNWSISVVPFQDADGFGTNTEALAQTQCDRLQSSSLNLYGHDQSVVVYYIITPTVFGALSVAFSKGDICMLDLCDTEEEALSGLEHLFKPPLHVLVSLSTLNDRDDLVYEVLMKKARAVIEALENPSGKTMHLPHPMAFLENKIDSADKN